MKRIKTDFLAASSSFLAGYGSLVCLDGNLFEYNASSEPDEIAIENDWAMTGQDIFDALDKVNFEERK